MKPNNLKKAARWLPVLLITLMAGRFLIQSYARGLTNSNSAEGDQSAYLQLALDLREHGVLTDGTRNPLYPAILAVFARRDWSFFTNAKLLSMALGAAAIVAVYYLGRRRFNTFTGLAAAYLLSINVEFIVHSATALAESLLVLACVLAFFAQLKALHTPQQGRWWLWAGILTGLALLSKGSGQLLVYVFIAGALVIHGSAVAKSRPFWLFVAGYALVGAPLWLFSAVQFGDPTFNYPIMHQMWMERWTDWHPEAANLPTLLSYLQSHTPAQIISRQWAGMQGMRNILIKTLWPTRTLMVDRFLLSPVSGYALAGLALLPGLFWPATRRYWRQQPDLVWLTGLNTAVFFVLFAWYVPIVALGQRFILPIIPFIFILMAQLVSQIWSRLTPPGSWFKPILLAAAAILLGYQGYWAVRTTIQPARTALTHNLYEQDARFNEDSAAPLRWLAQSAPGSTVAWGPPRNSLPAWAFSDRLNFDLYPVKADSLPHLTRQLTQRGAQFVIVDSDLLDRYEPALTEMVTSNGSQVDLRHLPPGWALTYAYRAMPCDWCVFRLLNSYPPQESADYQLGPAIRLVGYDLDRRPYRPGDTLRLTLHWQAGASPESDLTVFTQLLGPDSQLHGQMDHPPINGLWPTTRWQPGNRLADRYDLLLDPAALPGVYHVLVGMYNPQTGQRQPVTHQGQPVPDNAIFLAQIMVEVALH